MSELTYSPYVGLPPEAFENKETFQRALDIAIEAVREGLLDVYQSRQAGRCLCPEQKLQWELMREHGHYKDVGEDCGVCGLPAFSRAAP